MIYYAVFRRQKSTYYLRFILPSDLSSPAKETKCNEMPCFLSVTLEQPPTIHIYSVFLLFQVYYFFLDCLILYNIVHAIVFLYC